MKVNKYSSFPKDEIDPTQKDDQWGLKYMKAMYDRFLNDQTVIPYSNHNDMVMNNLYAKGMQPVEKYMDLFLGKKKAPGDTKRKGWYNINWDIFSPLPKYMSVIIGKLEEFDYKISANAIDDKAIGEKDDIKWIKWFKKEYPDIDGIMQELSGGRDQGTEYIPETKEELEMFYEMGGIKLRRELGMELAIDHGFYISNWKEISRKLRWDLIVNNVACVKHYTCSKTGKAKVKYVDPTKLILQYTHQNNFDKTEYGGEIVYYPISELRTKMPQVKESEWRILATKYEGRYGNSSAYNVDNYYYQDFDARTFNYDDFVVPILEAEWKSVNSEYYTKKNRVGDKPKLYKENFGKVTNTKNRKSIKSDIVVLYSGKWVIGTDYIFDFGLAQDIVRPNKKEVDISYKAYKLPGKSIVERGLSTIDSIQTTYLKMQNAKAKASNSGIAIEWSALQNISLGASKMKPMDLLKIKNQTGDLIYRATTHLGKYNPAAARPIMELRGGIGPYLQELIMIFDFDFRMLRELYGIDEFSSVSRTPTADTPVGTTQMAIQGTNDAIRPILSAYIDIKENVSKGMSLRALDIMKYSSEKDCSYIPVIGKPAYMAIKSTSDITDAQYGIKLQMLPDAKLREEVKMVAREAMKPGRDGMPGIDYADYLFISRQVEYGNLKYAEAYLNYKINKRRKEAQQQGQMAVQMEGQNMQQQMMAKRQMEMESKQFDAQIERDNKQFDGKLDFAKRQHEDLIKKGQMKLESDLSIREFDYENDKANDQEE